MEEETSYVKHDTHKTRRSVVTFLFPECTEVSCRVEVFPDEHQCCEEKRPLFSSVFFFIFFFYFISFQVFLWLPVFFFLFLFSFSFFCLFFFSLGVAGQDNKKINHVVYF